MKQHLHHLLLAVALLLAPALRADTVISDPKGKTLCMGQTRLLVSFDRVNFDQKLKDFRDKGVPSGKLQFLLLGMIDGRVVGADVTQEASRPTYNKLFYLTLMGDGAASFSGLVEDVIPLKGAMTLSDFVKIDQISINNYTRKFSATRYRGQLLSWEGKNTDGTVRKYVFLINGYQQDIAVFELKDSPAQGESIGQQELTYIRKLLLPSKGTTPYQDYYINSIDGIDLNALRDQGNTKEYPKALMVWCKPAGYTGTADMQLTAPIYALTCSLDDAVTTIKIESEDYFHFDSYSDSDTDYIENVVGGFLTAPDETGKLFYWCEKLKADSYWAYQKADAYMDVHKKLITYSPPSTGYPLGVVKTETSTYDSSWFYESDSSSYMENLLHSLYFENAGPRISIADDSQKTVRIQPAPEDNPSIAKKSKLKAGNDQNGIVDTASEYDVQKINKEIRVRGGAIPSNLNERLKRLAHVQGWTVLRVFLGQPYVAAPKLTPTDPVKPKMIYKECYISYKYDKSSLYQYAFNNGTATSQSYGVSGKKTKLFNKFDTGVKSTYEYKYNKATNAEVSIGVETEQRASGPSSFDQGTVVYTSMKPYITSLGRVVPQKGVTNLTVSGDPMGAFNILMINATPQQDAANPVVSYQNFSCSNPAVTSEGTDGTGKTYWDVADGSNNPTEFKTPYSVLSDGLVPRPVSSLIECNATFDDVTVDNARKLIQAWQSSNNIIADIHQFNSINGGISAYFGKVENGSMTKMTDGAVVTGFNQSAAFSIVHETETKVTRSHQGSVGFYWSLDFVGLFNTKGEVSYKGGREEINTDSEKYKFEVSMGGWDGAPSYKRTYYYYWVDIPSIKSYMASHSYTLQAGENKGTYTNEVHRPGFIPTYCWENNQSFMLGVPWLDVGLNARR